MRVLLSFALPHGHICASTSSSRLLVYLFFLPGRSRSPTRKRSWSVFVKSTGPCKYVFIPIPSLNPSCISNSLSDSTLFLSARLSLLSVISSTYALYLPNVTADITSSWFPPTFIRTFSTMPSHVVPARSFATFSHTALSIMAGNLFFGMFLCL